MFVLFIILLDLYSIFHYGTQGGTQWVLVGTFPGSDLFSMEPASCGFKLQPALRNVGFGRGLKVC